MTARFNSLRNVRQEPTAGEAIATWLTTAIGILLLAVLMFVAAPYATSPALSHQAASGWEYPISCCAGHDCDKISADRVSVSAGGYVIDGKFTVPYSETRNSPDGLYHACFPTPDNLKCFWAPPPGS